MRKYLILTLLLGCKASQVTSNENALRLRDCLACPTVCPVTLCEAVPCIGPDASTPGPDAGSLGGAWLHTEGNHIVTSSGQRWYGRGVNIHDTRGCNACAYNTPSVGEVKRRIDEAVAWGANFIRLDLEAYASAGGRLSWDLVQNDPQYLQHIVDIVEHVENKPGVYILVSDWLDPTHTAQDWPTDDSQPAWDLLARRLASYSKVMFGVANEPQANYNGAQDAQVWDAMNKTVTTIRLAEMTVNSPPHLVAVQGTRSWARVLDYYVTHPLGENVIYETHVYDPQSEFAARFKTPGITLPVIIGEFGPVSGYMTLADTQALMTEAEAAGVPWLAWTFHMRCSPNLLVDTSGGSCGIGMALTPTPWGEQVKAQLSKPLP